MLDTALQLAYLAASVLYVLGLRGVSHPGTARRGMLLAELGMLMAIVGTLLKHEIVRYEWIIAGIAFGAAIGAALSIWLPITAVPQLTAISHMFGALAATLVGVAEYYRHAGGVGHLEMAALGFEVMFGSLTITGSFMAFGKLQEIVKGAPITYRFQNPINISLFFVTLGMFAYLIFQPANQHVFYAMVGVGLLIGVFLVLPIGARTCRS